MCLFRRYIFRVSFILILILQLLAGCAGREKKLREIGLHYVKGTDYLNEGKLDKAEEEFTIALKIMPDHGRLHYGMARLYEKRGLIDDALKEYETAWSIYPYNAKLNYDTAEAYYKKGKIDKAIKRYRVGLVNVGNKDEGLKKKLFIGLGKSFFKKSDYELALEQFKHVLGIDQLSSIAHYYIARIYQQTWSIDVALQEYKRAVGMFYLLDEDNEDNKKYFAEVYKNYADALNENGFTSRAKDQMKKYREVTQQTVDDDK